MSSENNRDQAVRQTTGMKRTSSEIDVQLNHDIPAPLLSKAQKAVDDKYLYLAKRIFTAVYDDLVLSDGVEKCHDKYPTIKACPDMVQDDGTILMFRVTQDGKTLRDITEKDLHVCMALYKVTHANLVTIALHPSVTLYRITCRKPDFYSGAYNTIEQDRIKYDKTIYEKYYPNSAPQKRAKVEKFNPDEWVRASGTRNFALDDQLVDWLDLYYDKRDDLQKVANVNKKEFYENKYTMSGHAIQNGNIFEKKTVELLKAKFGNKFVTICETMVNYHNRVLEYEEKTIDAMKDGVPFIYQGVVLNRTGPLSKTYGLPDLIVRSDYLEKLVDMPPITKQEARVQAPKLNGNYYYVIVDLKCTTMNFCADGRRLLKSGSVPAFKCQLYIYTHAIGEIQGREPGSAYILAAGWKHKTAHIDDSSNNCFDRLGHIDYDDKDREYIGMTIESVNWLKDVKKNGKDWQLYPKPSHPYLYPNMNNHMDSAYDQFKKKYAQDIKELTLLWNCGVKNRVVAHKNGVYRYDDPECCAEILGSRGDKVGPTLDKIIDINRRNDFITNWDRISITLDPAVNNAWKDRSDLRISVDFETISGKFDDFISLPISPEHNYLFMIGVSIQYKKQKPIYEMFLTSELSKDAELELLYQFYEYLCMITDDKLGVGHQIPPICHWGHIERTYIDGLYERLLAKYSGDTVVSENLSRLGNNIQWYDMCDVFRRNPIVINGCFGFGLKEISTRLHELGLISICWDDNNPCKNGYAAMMMANEVYDQVRSTGDKNIVRTSQIMKHIMDYNEVDCSIILAVIDCMIEKVKRISA
jgi:hypothetical protein